MPRPVADTAGAVSLALVDATGNLRATRNHAPPSAPALSPVAELTRREQCYRRLLAGADAVAVLLAVISGAVFLGQSLRWTVIAAPLFFVLTSKVQGLYDRDEMVIRKSTLGEWRELLEATTIASICVYLSWRLLTSAPQGPGMRLFLFLVSATSLFAISGRTLARAIARRTSPPERCVIAGDLDHCAHLAETLSTIDGVELVGAVAIKELGFAPDDVRGLVDELRIHRLVIAPRADAWDAPTLELVRSAKLIGIRVSIVPTVLAAVGNCAAFDELDGHMLLGVPRFGLNRSSWAIKRAFDLIGSTLGLLALAPLMLVIAACVRLDSRGPVLFRQKRIGRGGQAFMMLKFRSMIDGADAMKHTLVSRNEARDGLFKIADDPRITKVGKLLRATHLDELPQLINVLRGEMSLVGPRPLITEEDDKIAGGDRVRLTLTPGITGPWQVCGPMKVTLSEMVKLDYLYISNWSLWGDVDILIKTAMHVLARGGA